MDIFASETFYLNYFNFKSEAAAYFNAKRIKRWTGDSMRIPKMYNKELFQFEKHMMAYCVHYTEPYDPVLVGYIDVTYKDGVRQQYWYTNIFKNQIEEYEDYDYSREEERYCKQLFEDNMKAVIGGVNKQNPESIRGAIKRVEAFKTRCEPIDWENYSGDHYIIELMQIENALLTVNGVKYSTIEERDKARNKFEKLASDAGDYFISVFKGDRTLAEQLVRIFNNDSEKNDLKGFYVENYYSDKNSECLKEALEKTEKKFGADNLSIKLVQECEDFIGECNYMSKVDIRRENFVSLARLAGEVLLTLALVTFQVLLFTTFHFGFIIETLIHLVILTFYELVNPLEIIRNSYDEFASFRDEYNWYITNNQRDKKI